MPVTRRSLAEALVRWVAILLLSSSAWVPFATSFNIDVDHARVYSGDAGSLFGFSVGLYESHDAKWILVGAPKANDSNVRYLVEPGVLYRCPTSGGAKCEPIPVDNRGNIHQSKKPRYLEIRDGQWLGVALDSQAEINGKIIVCGHRWINSKYKKEYMMNGVCYETGLYGTSGNVSKLLPLVEHGKQYIRPVPPFVPNYKLGMAGMTVHYVPNEPTLLIGAPGVHDLKGAVIRYTYSSEKQVTKPPSTVPPDSYLGYALTSGTVRRSGNRYSVTVTGAPRWMNRGKVFVYKDDFVILTQKDGEQMGAYFGASVCCVDVNGDGLDDLLVGAPLYTETHPEEGRVYVYLSTDMDWEKAVVLSGDRQRSARFGSAISSPGDTNKDGYKDILIGAPYEQNGAGAVYIYHGSPEGIMTSYSQRIGADQMSGGLRGFGYSMSRGLDIDDNRYEDVAIGAYASDHVVLLRTRPVIGLDITLELEPKVIDLNKSNCMDTDGNKAFCIGVNVTILYRGERLPNTIDIKYNIIADASRSQRWRALVKTEEGLAPAVSQHIKLTKNQRTSDLLRKVIIQNKIRDVVTPIVFVVNVTLNTSFAGCTLCPMLDALKPTSIQKKVLFKRECGFDDICTTDIGVQAEIISSLQDGAIVIGQKQDLEIMVTINNKGEPSYMTDVTITLPEKVSFVGGHTYHGDTNVICNPSKRPIMDKDKNQTVVICDVGNPMKAMSQVMFRVRLKTYHVQTDADTLLIHIEATTGSDEIPSYLDDNTVQLKIPFIVKTNMILSGVSRPEQEVRMDVNSTSNVIVDVTHLYDVRNLGPGILLMGRLEITVPQRLINGYKLLSIKKVAGLDNKERMIKCSFEGSDSQDKQLDSRFLTQETINGSGGIYDLSYPRIGSVLVYKKLESLNIDCTTAECVRIACSLGHMMPEDSTVVTLRFSVRMAALASLEKVNSIDLTSEAVVYSVSPLDRGHSKTTQVVTHFYAEKAVKTGNLPFWVIGVSVAGGLITFIIITIILFKCGFFRRKLREELLRRQRESMAHLTDYCDYDGDDWEAESLTSAHAQSNPIPPSVDVSLNGSQTRHPTVFTSSSQPYDDSYTVDNGSPWIIRGPRALNNNTRSAQRTHDLDRPFTNGGHHHVMQAPWTYGVLPAARNISNPSYNGHPNMYRHGQT